MASMIDFIEFNLFLLVRGLIKSGSFTTSRRLSRQQAYCGKRFFFIVQQERDFFSMAREGSL
ncbi:hypothetical protein SAMN04488502_101996 [Dendrosporobacter quercicolus]|uniref:Uncharacterized protein n=1 Tax=Dendrosporobacter quercicolus TaxID=146817 RepID=A0A1G9NF59_9FIRM|nr:hypothetical protein SAMN04488502_101996 [Dendrosporobacter quercicolus]